MALLLRTKCFDRLRHSYETGTRTVCSCVRRIFHAIHRHPVGRALLLSSNALARPYTEGILPQALRIRLESPRWLCRTNR